MNLLPIATMSNSVFRIWSMTSQQFMVLKQKEGTTDFHASSSGTGKEESSKLFVVLWILNAGVFFVTSEVLTKF